MSDLAIAPPSRACDSMLLYEGRLQGIITRLISQQILGYSMRVLSLSV
jgi:hypothetical protein